MTNDFRGLTVEAARRELTRRLRDHAIDTPELDARTLTGAVLGLDLTGLATAAARRVNDSDAATLSAFAERRLAGEPVARIVGTKEFWGLPLRLADTTLVPRPDTETVVEAALDALRDGPPPRRIVDIGTGSGALLLALLSEWPTAWGVGIDIDEATLRVAADNARQLGFGPRAAFVRGDYLAALDGRFDLIVTNPPYIPSAEIDTLDIEVRAHDPRRALDGGADGLDAYRSLIPQAAARLAEGGLLLLEIGLGQSEAVDQLVTVAGLTLGPAWPDLSGVLRVVSGRNRAPQGAAGQ